MRLFIRPTGFGARVAGRGFSVVSAVLRRITGGDLIADLSEFFAAIAGLLGGFRDRAERVEGLLADERTTFLVVTGPQASRSRRPSTCAASSSRATSRSGRGRQPRSHDGRARRARGGLSAKP